MTNVENIIGVDLGGTNIRAGKIQDDKIVHSAKLPTPSKGSVEEVMNQIYAVIDSCFDAGTLSIGVGVPSVVDVEKGIVYDVTNIPSWKAVPVKDLLETRYKVPVCVNNDANCFVVGEKYFGKARSFKNIVGVTLGTGLGCGLIFNGKLYEGSNCGAGEFGNVPYLSHNVEYYCSGQFFTDEKKVNAIEIFHLAGKGDKYALQLFAEYGNHLGEALKSILYAYDPEVVILGGSVSQSFQFFKDAMYNALQDFAFSSVLANLKIDVSELENSAIFGAAALPMIKQ
ncbi:MAG TPA: ROK family protein [Prolixibacteraceae bacterium]|nr:ROK family protein [Prolixibacteraceae bacterium]